MILKRKKLGPCLKCAYDLRASESLRAECRTFMLCTTITSLSLIGLLLNAGCGGSCGDFVFFSGCPDVLEEVALGSIVEFVIDGVDLDECDSEVIEGEAKLIGADCNSVQVVPAEPGFVVLSIVVTAAEDTCQDELVCYFMAQEPKDDP